MSLQEITEQLHRQLPLTAAMGVRVDAWDGTTISLHAPLALNYNHMDTAFGGSISALSILAGYALLHLHLDAQKIDAHVLIQQSSVDFLRLIDTDLHATASLPLDGLSAFETMLTQKRRARTELISEIFSQGTLSARHTGVFVAILR